MEKHKRIKPKLTDLKPEKVSDIFIFLEGLFENDIISIESFNSRLFEFSLYQQYFIIKYGKQYFDLNDESSYLSKRLDDLEQDIESQVEEDAFKVYKKGIINTNQLLQKKFNLLEKNVGNRIKYYLKHGIQSNLSSITSEIFIDKKIPVYLKSQEFKKTLYTTLKMLYSKEQIDQFYSNSFQSSIQSFPPKLLYLEIEDSAGLYSAIYKLFKNRFKYVSENLRTLNSKYNYRIGKMPLGRKDFYSKLNTDKVNRYDFMCAMFNAFPQIRDSYYKALKENPALILKDYLTTKSRNIRA